MSLSNKQDNHSHIESVSSSMVIYQKNVCQNVTLESQKLTAVFYLVSILS